MVEQIDDAGVALGGMGMEGVRQQQWGTEVDAHVRIKRGVLKALGIVEFEQGCVVDHRAQRPQRIDGARHQVTRLVFNVQARDEDSGTAPERANIIGRMGCLIDGAMAVDRDIKARAREFKRDRAAKPACGAGHQDRGGDRQCHGRVKPISADRFSERVKCSASAPVEFEPMKAPTSLPPPEGDERAASEALVASIAQAIRAAGGSLPFDDYMRRALYTPGLGYYTGGAHKFGRWASDGSDFVTAPELSPLFARALATQLAQILAAAAPAIMEFGAGTGRLAADLLNALGPACTDYAIVEVSAVLRARQRDTLAAVAPDHAHKVRWLEALPDRFSGAVLGNEVLDAMPVQRVMRTAQGWDMLGVGLAPDAPLDTLIGVQRPCTAAELALITEWIPEAATLPLGYQTEMGIEAAAFARTLAQMLERGAVVMVDYGFPADEFYHAERRGGTLMCHRRHRAHDDPLWWPGCQDITAHVDFSSIALAWVQAGATLAGYTTQGRFLLNCGLLDQLSLQGEPGSLAYAQATAALLPLLNESEMGELFKVIACTRGLDEPLLGFAQGDRTRML